MIARDEDAIQYVLAMAKERDVNFIRLWFTDILGTLKGVAITAGELEGALRDGVGFDGSSIEGFARIDESDMIMLPDPNTFRLLPWRPKEKAVAAMFCDILTPTGHPFEGDPRYVLRRNLEHASKLGYTYYVGPELEYFYFKSSNGTEPLDQDTYFDGMPLEEVADLRRETVLFLEEMGIPVEFSHHEVAPSQHEIDLRYTDALTMADTVMMHRLVVKEVAMRHGAYATFMPKPVMNMNGSGMHVHQSLFRGEENAFFDPNDPLHLSKVARCFLGGLMRHAAEFTAVTNQWVNSYKRLVPGYEAPIYISWAHINRSDLIRVPVYKPGRSSSVRLEYRSPDPACNPYLAFSVMLAAGLEGLEKGYEPPLPVEENVYKMTPEERARRGIKTLPGNLWEAVVLTEGSEVVRRALGEHVFNSFIENKRIEWERYSAHVTDYELKRYLPIL